RRGSNAVLSPGQHGSSGRRSDIAARRGMRDPFSRRAVDRPMDILAVVVPEVPMPLHPVPSVPRVGRAPRCRPALCAALVALALSSLLALVPAGPAGAAAGFPDVPVGHFAVTPITWGVGEGLTRGVGSTGLFMPDRDITRAE